MMEIKLFQDTREWQLEALTNIFKHKNSVIVAHRRSGKTELSVIFLILQALSITRKHPIVELMYLAPFRKQAKDIAWTRLKYFCRKIPNTKIFESELKIIFNNGSIIRLEGGDRPDAIRGSGLDAIIIDESAQIKSEIYYDIIIPMLADRNGKTLFIGTPKGMNNLFYEVYSKYSKDPKWFVGYYPANRTNIFTKEQLEELREQQGELSFNQEFLLDWEQDNSDIFITNNLYYEAVERPNSINNQSALVFGFDAARFGNDRSVLVARKGTDLIFIKSWVKKDLIESSHEIINNIKQYKPKITFIDEVGLGAGIVDYLKSLGYNIKGVNSGRKAKKEKKFSNHKAEMWSNMRDWLETASLINYQSDDLRIDLTGTMYSFDNQNRLVIESKKDLKKRGLPSSDIADALALTFSEHINTNEQEIQEIYLNNIINKNFNDTGLITF